MGNCSLCQQIRAGSIRIGERAWVARIIHVVVNRLAITIEAVFYTDTRRQSLVRACQSRISKRVEYYFFLKFIGERGSFIGQHSFAEMVARDRRVPSEKW